MMFVRWDLRPFIFKSPFSVVRLFVILFLMWFRCVHVCTYGKKMKGENFINAKNSTYKCVTCGKSWLWNLYDLFLLKQSSWLSWELNKNVITYSFNRSVTLTISCDSFLQSCDLCPISISRRLYFFNCILPF